MSILGWDSKLSGRLISPYHFKTNRMLLSDKSFCFFEINGWPLSPENFTILTKTSRRVERYRGLLSILCGPMVIYTPVCIYNHDEFSAIVKNEN